MPSWRVPGYRRRSVLTMKLSVVTPAHNEERHIAACLSSVFESAKHAAIDFEHIVVLNRCNDRTEEFAVSSGCRIVREDARNLSKIRNAGVSAATGEIIVTIDADSVMSRNMLVELCVRSVLDGTSGVASGSFPNDGLWESHAVSWSFCPSFYGIASAPGCFGVSKAILIQLAGSTKNVFALRMLILGSVSSTSVVNAD